VTGQVRCRQVRRHRRGGPRARPARIGRAGGIVPRPGSQRSLIQAHPRTLIPPCPAATIPAVCPHRRTAPSLARIRDRTAAPRPRPAGLQPGFTSLTAIRPRVARQIPARTRQARTRQARTRRDGRTRTYTGASRARPSRAEGAHPIRVADPLPMTVRRLIRMPARCPARFPGPIAVPVIRMRAHRLQRTRPQRHPAQIRAQRPGPRRIPTWACHLSSRTSFAPIAVA
jgi:hypothetical protein